MPRPKICHVLTSFDAGGATENTFVRLRHLAGRADFWVVAGKSSLRFFSLEKELSSVGVNFFESKYLSNSFSLLNDFLAFFELLFFFRKHRFDAVHTHNTKAGIVGRLAAFFAGIPLVVHEIHSLPMTNSRAMTALYFFLEKIISARTSVFLSVSEQLRKKFCSLSGVPEKKVLFFPTAIELQENIAPADTVRKSLGLKQNEIAVGMIARMSLFKRPDLFLEVASLLADEKNLKFFFVGGGEEKNMVERLIAGKNLSSSVKLLGFVEPEKVPFLVNAFDIVLHASEKDAVSRSIVLAMFLGKPVVCFDVGENSEVVKSNETGFVVRFADTVSAAEKVLFLSKNPVLRKSFGRNAKRLVSERYNIKKYDSLLEGIYFSRKYS